ncbi:hypothetical protein WJX84_004782 [Apatococcus fuscideae]|uniref:Uncharacterized protein n=1 Tax=Apatococcus fuscideae TaxID=2026836 RepID=A0AAW1T0D4_9CHLO
MERAPSTLSWQEFLFCQGFAETVPQRTASPYSADSLALLRPPQEAEDDTPSTGFSVGRGSGQPSFSQKFMCKDQTRPPASALSAGTTAETLSRPSGVDLDSAQQRALESESLGKKLVQPDQSDLPHELAYKGRAPKGCPTASKAPGGRAVRASSGSRVQQAKAINLDDRGRKRKPLPVIQEDHECLPSFESSPELKRHKLQSHLEEYTGNGYPCSNGSRSPSILADLDGPQQDVTSAAGEAVSGFKIFNDGGLSSPPELPNQRRNGCPSEQNQQRVQPQEPISLLALARQQFLEELEPSPLWEETCPVQVKRLKRALLEGELNLEIHLQQFNLTLPLGALLHDQLQALVHRVLAKMAKVAALCGDALSESPETKHVISRMGEAMCMLVVLGDTRTLETLKAQGFHASNGDRPAPPGIVEASVAAARLTPVQAAHTRLLHYNFVRKADELSDKRHELAAEMTAAGSRGAPSSAMAPCRPRMMAVLQELEECVRLEAELNIQMQQSFCLQVLSPFQAAKMFCAAVPYSLDIGDVMGHIDESHAGPLA